MTCVTLDDPQRYSSYIVGFNGFDEFGETGGGGEVGGEVGEGGAVSGEGKRVRLGRGERASLLRELAPGVAVRLLSWRPGGLPGTV